MLSFEQLFVCRDVRLTDDKRLSLLDHGYEFGHSIRQLVVFGGVTTSQMQQAFPFELEVQSLAFPEFKRMHANNFVLRPSSSPLTPSLLLAAFPVAGLLTPGY